jgi:hypothetical protein
VKRLATLQNPVHEQTKQEENYIFDRGYEAREVGMLFVYSATENTFNNSGAESLEIPRIFFNR